MRYRELVPEDVLLRTTFTSYGFEEGTPRKHGDFSALLCDPSPASPAPEGLPCAEGDVTYAWWDPGAWGAKPEVRERDSKLPQLR